MSESPKAENSSEEGAKKESDAKIEEEKPDAGEKDEEKADDDKEEKEDIKPKEEEKEEKPLENLSDKDKVEVITSAVRDLELLDVLVCGKCFAVYHFVEEFKEHKSNEKGCEDNETLREGLRDTTKKPTVWAFSLWKNTRCTTMKEEVEKETSSWGLYQKFRALDAAKKKAWIRVSESLQSLQEIINDFERAKIEMEKECANTKDEDEKNSKVVIVNSKPSSNTRKARRTGSEGDFLVEKFISKRHNARRRCFEYLVKWESLDSEKNSWEPAAALFNCKNMMEEFDKKFQQQREQMRMQKLIAKKAMIAKRAEMLQNAGRPQRTSKQKALNQVKAWCGNMESDEASGKRAFSDDSDEDESFEKRMRLEEDSSDSEGDKPTSSKATKTYTVKTQNGVEVKKTTTITLPENILIPDAKGIVRINQKQIPSLSSGVYVMSKTAGIIKLDADASKLATSGGQKILKVTQSKLGQPTVKVIKKEISNGSSANKNQGTLKSPLKPVMRNYSGKVYMQKRTNAQIAQALVKKDEIKKEDEDESDGVEELEFPDEIQLPTADSPPPESTLCPLTGKVIDKDGNIMESEDAASATGKSSTKSGTENMVNIAAADILNDLEITKTTATPMTTMSAKSETKTVHINPPRVVQKTTIITSTGSRVVQQVVQQQTKPKMSSNSILSTALTSANILRRGPPKLVPRSTPRPAIISAPTRVGTPRMQTMVTRITPSAAGTPRTRIIHQQRPTTHIIRKRVVQTSPQLTTVNRSVVRKVQMPAVNSRVNTFVVTPTSGTKVIHHGVPPLIVSETPSNQASADSKATEKQAAVTAAAEKTKAVAASVAHTASVSPATTTAAPVQQTQTISLTDADTPLLITGEDGTIYQVAGQNEDGQTILITQGEDGEQQCLLVAPENAALINQAIMKPVAEATPQQQQQQQPQPQPEQTVVQPEAVQPTAVLSAETSQHEEATDESQVVAQIVSANPPSPGGTRKVVLMLPDGNYMMTEVTADQYAALELDK